MERYRKLSRYFKERYGVRIQRIPIFAGFTCPNRDGTKGKGGCIFCDATGSGFAAFRNLSIKEQVFKWKEIYKRKFKNVKFFAYFQAFSNTYAPVEILREKYSQALADDEIIGLDISTRPDVLPEEVLDLLEEFRKKVEVHLELGLQTANYKTLKILNRGHTLAEFIDATIRAKKRNFAVVTHVIVNLPWDDIEDVVETAKIISALGIDGVKIHSLYIVKNTPLAKMYEKGKVKMGTLEDYIDRVITFLEYLSPSIVIHRLAADPPHEGTIFGNWGLSKTQVVNLIEKELEKRNTWQGKKYNYL
ncbi:MAG: TIGR01212 family radical SAM protein [Thermotogaceae bacterium]|nr:TIGR01212 family radical SAM protein [Thermotogaceae bacterium]